MRVFRFDPDAGAPAGEGVLLVCGTRTDGPARFDLLRYEPGAVVRERPASGDRLLLVVAGRGWASGGDGVRRVLATGEAARFEDGELHASGSDEGMTAIVVEAAALDLARLQEAEPKAEDGDAFVLATYRDGDDPVRRAFLPAREAETPAPGRTILETSPASALHGRFFFCEFAQGRHAAASTEELLARLHEGERVRVIRGPYDTRGEADQGMGELLG